MAFNTLVQFFGKLISSGIGFVITLIIARYFGVEGFGEFTKITAYVALFYLVSDFGLNAVFLKEEKKEKLSFINLLSLRIAWSAVLVFFALAILIFLPADLAGGKGYSLISKVGILITLPTVLTYAVSLSFNALFQKNLRYDRSVLAASLGSLTTIFLLYIFVRVKLPLTFSLSSYLLGGMVGITSAYFLAKKYLGKQISLADDFLIQNLTSWKTLFKKSLPLGLTLIFNLIYFRFDIFILAFARPNIDVGIYGLAYKFFEFPLAIPTFFMNAIYPVILRSKLNPPAGGLKSKITKKATVFLLTSSLAIGAACLILAPLISLVKADFTASILPFRILSLSLPLFFLTSFYMWIYVADGRQNKLLLVYGIGMVFNILLNLIFIPKFGYNGAAVITVISEGLVLFLLVKFRKNKNLK
ncbi:MAG: Polysaccharide biosynthesis protein, membrane-associated [Candidatus Levybacteria bacterium GW2011_GWA2_40_8]|nr:MAG: Polysaccharide biosynthesis protein, membrane-associated [Candidatus Levybacteria bacterium GW2011_GWA2_40_8]